MEKVDRLGENKIMKCGELATIIRYNNSKDIDIKFEKTNEIIHNVWYSTFKKGNIKSHFSQTVQGFGICGLEKVKDENGIVLKSYKSWNRMIQRCYNKKIHKRFSTYSKCEVCEDWRYYSNFKKWFNENYYEIDGDKMCLDKDILHKGNKIYSPDTCIFVPNRINILFTKSNSTRGKYPIGVSYKKSINKFVAKINYLQDTKNKIAHLGCFNTEIEAFNAYKKAKELYIKQIANEYKDKIPKKLYNAMYNYEVEITD